VKKPSTHNSIITEIAPLEPVPIEALKPTAKNARNHSKQQIRLIARSIETFGFVVPIVVDSGNEIICGNAVYLAAQLLGLDHIPVIRVTHLDKDKLRAFQIAHNRIAEHSSWDDQILGEVLQDLSSKDLDFNLEEIGFSTTEIDLLIDGIEQHPADADASDAVSPLDAGLPVTKPGDTWIMDGHRVHCGNSLEFGSYQAVIDNAQAALVITDPPYNVAIGGHVGGNGQVRHREFAMASGEMKPEEFIDFLTAIFEQLVRFSADGSLHYVFMDWRHATELLTAGNATYARLINLCTWVKKNGGMGSFYRSRHELVFVFKNGTAPHRNNIELGKHGRNRTNVWEYDGINSFGRVTDEGNLLAMHPTVKPVQMIVDAILDCSGRGDILLDPFLGSGSSLIAAERTGRVLRGIEMDPLYVDVAVRRWQRHTGGHAVHAASGDRFDDIANRTRVTS
jgi:DNA modification methylase